MDEEDVKTCVRRCVRPGASALRAGRASGSVGRLFGIPVRLLGAQFGLPAQALYRVHGPVNLARLTQLIDLVDRPELCFPRYEPSYPLQIQAGRSFLSSSKATSSSTSPSRALMGVLDFPA